MSFNVFFHPFFQILDDPFSSPSPSSRSRQPSQSQSPQSPSRQTPAPSSPSPSQNNVRVFEGPIFNSTRRLRSPAVEVNEEKDTYVVEAELPGVRKEDVDVRIGDGGRSLTIEGRSVRRFGRGVEAPVEGLTKVGAQGTTETNTNTTTTTTTTKPPEASQQLSNSDNKTQTQTRNRDSDSNLVGTNRSVFSRTVWLPRPVDAKNVQASLDHGVLTLRIPKAAEGTTRIPIL